MVLLFGDGELSNREKALVVLARPCRNIDAPASGRSTLVKPLPAARGQFCVAVSIWAVCDIRECIYYLIVLPHRVHSAGKTGGVAPTRAPSTFQPDMQPAQSCPASARASEGK